MTIDNIIQTHKDAIADLETVQTVIGELSGMIECEDMSPLYHLSFEEDETLYKLNNPRAPQIITDIIQLISDHYLGAQKPVTGTLFITPKEG